MRPRRAHPADPDPHAVILESGIGGAYHAVFKGRGMEFAEVREYAPGDEVRTIDWNVTARMGAPYVKKFVEERDLTLLLVVDVSGLAGVRLALPAQARLRRRARRGARVLGGREPRPRRLRRSSPTASRATCRRGRGRDHALRIVRDLLAREPAGPRHRPRRRAALRRSACCKPPRHRGRRSPTSRPRAGSARSASCAAATTSSRCTCATRARRACPAAGLVAFVDPETGQRVVADTSRPEVRRALRAPGFAAAQAVFRKTRVDALALDTGESYERPLSAFFKSRERRR